MCVCMSVSVCGYVVCNSVVYVCVCAGTRYMYALVLLCLLCVYVCVSMSIIECVHM